ncbi:MAG: malto-oligosyltrehalose trehalohydrolase [Firmicutes bacterium]|nr:malto-oligosyltrehalose trehalohydrolase [Bacillota bacterium]
MIRDVTLGAKYLGKKRCRFCVWAPDALSVSVHIVEPEERSVVLERDKHGYHDAVVTGVDNGSLYYYILDGEKERPDPASRYQPQGVHGPSQVVDPNGFQWSDHHWSGLDQKDLVFYELHVGTFTDGGTFQEIIHFLPQLKELGITAVELMPLAQFPGSRNWGYDGVYPFAVQNSYGGPEALRRLVDACHNHGMAVFVDVVYNHLGPEGNYLADFGPYFTDHYHTPWGKAINFDGGYSSDVRRYFVENALYWVSEFHIDGLRLDAIHAILDLSALHFLEELGEAVHQKAQYLGRRVQVIGESDLNSPRVIRPRVVGGYGLDGQWSDDFHHALHALITGEQQGYYRDFGSISHMAKAFGTGYVYTGQYSKFRRRRHGDYPELCPSDRFIVFSQNHDQVGNRALGNRLTTLVSFAGCKLAACVVLLSPFIPLLFMGEEYGEEAPFQYFTSHTDPELVEAVRRGRRQEFSGFDWQGEVPDPQDENTFLRSRLNHDLCRKGHHKVLRELYRQLLRQRRELKPLLEANKDNLEVIKKHREGVLFLKYRNEEDQLCLVFSFNDDTVTVVLPVGQGNWYKRIDTAEEQWMGGGSLVPNELESAGDAKITLKPLSCILFHRAKEE